MTRNEEFFENANNPKLTSSQRKLHDRLEQQKSALREMRQKWDTDSLKPKTDNDVEQIINQQAETADVEAQVLDKNGDPILGLGEQGEPREPEFNAIRVESPAPVQEQQQVPPEADMEVSLKAESDEARINRLEALVAGIIAEKLNPTSGKDDYPLGWEPSDASSGTAEFSGVAYVAGTRYSGLDSDSSKPWIKIDLYSMTVTEESGPPSSPFPPNEEWYEKAQTAGDIHLTRL